MRRTLAPQRDRAADGALRNADAPTVAAFGDEWRAFDQSGASPAELDRIFAEYFRIFPFDTLPPGAIGFDLGCGSGRWAERVARRTGHVACIDASAAALGVARAKLATVPNVSFHHASVETLPLPDASQDFGYALGVLHHVPDPQAGLAACVEKLRPGAPFLVYLYSRLDERPAWYRALWRASDVVRRTVSRLPAGPRRVVTDLLAGIVYWPLARLARLGGRAGLDTSSWPLSAYATRSFYTMRTDALDRFGTPLERRFSRAEVAEMMARAGLVEIRFSEGSPFWTAVGRRRAPAAKA